MSHISEKHENSIFPELTALPTIYERFKLMYTVQQ